MQSTAILAFALLAGSLTLCAPNAARAATCQVSATAVRFGNYNPLNVLPRNITSRIVVTCRGRGTFNVALSTGRSGSYNPRYMLSGATVDQLDYNLYVDAAHTSIWGDGTGGTVTVSRPFNNNRQRLSVHAQIPAQQNVTAGTYTDNITATVTF
jgi:spore coat protein U-like protein